VGSGKSKGAYRKRGVGKRVRKEKKGVFTEPKRGKKDCKNTARAEKKGILRYVKKKKKGRPTVTSKGKTAAVSN